MPDEVGIIPKFTVAVAKANELAEEYLAKGLPIPPSISRNLPVDVRAAVKEIIKKSGLDSATVASLRKARTVELMLNDDPDIVAKGVTLSQKEDGVGVAGAVQQNNNFQFNHFATVEPPDGRKLLAEDAEVVDVPSEQ